MLIQMSAPNNPRKRAAPSSPPAMQNVQIPTQYFPTTNGMSQADADFLIRSQGGKGAQYQDSTGYNMNAFAGNPLPQPPYDQPASTQLARRPHNRQLVSTGQRPAFDVTGSNDAVWGQFGDESILDPQNAGMEENDNIELLEEKAAVAKRDAQAKRKQIPPFVQKLSSFLDKSENTELIRWSDRGDSFIVVDEDEFAKTLIPELFKHNNYASFVRQLNMYGFHKRVGLSDNSMKASERKNKSPSEYYNPYFKRGHPNLLWLINKPKNGSSKSKDKSKRVKAEEGDADSDEDGKDGVEEIHRENMPGTSRALSQAPQSGPLQQQQQLVSVQKQLNEIKNNQAAMRQALSRLQHDHRVLSTKAMGFNELHTRHENSINAILSFLATLYHRSIDSGNMPPNIRDLPPNIAQMFANGNFSDPQNQGNIVEIAEQFNQNQDPGNMSPQRRTQRLLMPPPNQRARTLSPVSAASTPGNQNKSGTIEEVYEDSPRVKVEHETPLQMPSMLYDHNASNASFLDQPSLTDDQHKQMLDLMNSTTDSSSSNILAPSPMPDIQMQMTQDDIDNLLRLQNANDEKIDQVKDALNPLESTFYDPNNIGADIEPNPADLDINSYLDPSAYYNGSSPTTGSFNYDAFGDGGGNLDFGFDGGNDDSGRIVETESSTPEEGTTMNGNGGSAMTGVTNDGPKSPNKKRRKN